MKYTFDELKKLNQICVDNVGVNPYLCERYSIHGSEEFHEGLDEMGICICDTACDGEITKHTRIILGLDGTYKSSIGMYNLAYVPLLWGEHLSLLPKHVYQPLINVMALYHCDKEGNILFEYTDNISNRYLALLLQSALEKHGIDFENHTLNSTNQSDCYWQGFRYLGNVFDAPSVIKTKNGYYIAEFSSCTMRPNTFDVHEMDRDELQGLNTLCVEFVGVDPCLAERCEKLSRKKFDEGLKKMGIYIMYATDRIPEDALIVLNYRDWYVWSKRTYKLSFVPLYWGHRIEDTCDDSDIPDFGIAKLKCYYEDKFEYDIEGKECIPELLFKLMEVLADDTFNCKDYLCMFQSSGELDEIWNCIKYIGYSFNGTDADRLNLNNLLSTGDTKYKAVFNDIKTEVITPENFDIKLLSLDDFKRLDSLCIEKFKVDPLLQHRREVLSNYEFDNFLKKCDIHIGYSAKPLTRGISLGYDGSFCSDGKDYGLMVPLLSTKGLREDTITTNTVSDIRDIIIQYYDDISEYNGLIEFDEFMDRLEGVTGYETATLAYLGYDADDMDDNF